MRFLALFCSLVCWNDLILHIVIVLNVFQRLATLPGHAGSFKNQKNAVLNDPKSQKRFLTIFWSWVCWIDLILHIVIVLNVFQYQATLPGHEGSFKSSFLQKSFLQDGFVGFVFDHFQLVQLRIFQFFSDSKNILNSLLFIAGPQKSCLLYIRRCKCGRE